VIKRPFREHHLLELLNIYSSKSLPLDIVICDYFKLHKALGSKDRAFIAETAYGMIRKKSLLQHLTKNSSCWEKMLECYLQTDSDRYVNDETIPIYIRNNFPEILFNLLLNTYGLDKTVEFCKNSNERAPATVRANTLKISRDKLMDRWKDLYDISPCTHSSKGIIFNQKLNFFGLPEFKEGFFEVQDEGSQLLADLIGAGPGDSVLDYCAGAGGKSLAFAPDMQQKGQLYLHDIRENALLEARKRLKRAGIQNAQILRSDSPHLKNLKKKMDIVLVDAPCSGTGTLRRNPDMKWRFDEDTIPKLASLQRVIFEKALSFMKPGGKIIYATCSVLQEENMDQINRFISTYDLVVVDTFQSTPTQSGMDGFFACVLKRA